MGLKNFLKGKSHSRVKSDGNTPDRSTLGKMAPVKVPVDIKTLGNTDFIRLPAFIKGKVRDVYDLGENLLVVSTDRISAFDVVFNELIPYKGKVLSGISEFWFRHTADVMPNHFITSDVSLFPKELFPFAEILTGRSMLVRKLKMLPVECIVRGYLEGSGFKEYLETGSVSGIKMPEGLKQCDKLPEPVFTPTTKEHSGHDVSITFGRLESMIGAETAAKVRSAGISLYNAASRYAVSKGIILADTKFEFGMQDGKLAVADEIFTPDSSRFWIMSDYAPGRPQKSFDKQFLREYLDSFGWDKNPPPPKLPEDVISKTSAKYIEAYEVITGNKMV